MNERAVDVGIHRQLTVQPRFDCFKFVLGAKHEVMGSALHVPLVPGIQAGSLAKVAIFYKTTKGSTALQWLAKE